MSDKERIEELYRTYWQCMIDKDTAELERVADSLQINAIRFWEKEMK